MIAKIRTVLGRGAIGALTSGAMVAFGALSAEATEYFATAAEVDDATCDCSSEANAGSLANAMARATDDGDVVTLLPGTYDMTKFTPTGGVYFNVKKAITIRSQDEDASTVTLKGGGTTVTARCFEFASTAAIVRGISFAGFYAHNSSAGVVKGGKLYDCVFAGNALRGTAGTCVNGSICHDCTFTDNVYTNSGTHYLGGGAGSGGSYFGCRFERNRSKPMAIGLAEGGVADERVPDADNALHPAQVESGHLLLFLDEHVIPGIPVNRLVATRTLLLGVAITVIANNLVPFVFARLSELFVQLLELHEPERVPLLYGTRPVEDFPQ